MRRRQELNKVIRRSMQQKIKNRELKQETVMKQFEAALKYRIKSRWFGEIADNPRAYEYYSLLYANEGEAFEESMDFSRDYPLRTFELWRAMTFSDGFPRLDGMALSPMEYELLLRCAGKRSLSTIQTELYELFGGSYEDEAEFRRHFVDMLRRCDDKYWLTHFVI
jgi:hypothetical protein